jgi:hypothetical protein
LNEIDEILEGIRADITKNTYSSLRNSVRSLTDVCKLFLSKFEVFNPNIKVKNLPLGRKFEIVSIFVPDIQDSSTFFQEVHEYRNQVDHNDTFVPHSQTIVELMIRFNTIVCNWEERLKRGSLLETEENSYFENTYMRTLMSTQELLKKIKELKIESDIDLGSYILKKSDLENVPCNTKLRKYLELREIENSLEYLIQQKEEEEEIGRRHAEEMYYQNMYDQWRGK